MDKAKFKSVMVLHGDTQGRLAEALEMAQETLSRKLNEQGEFSQSEIKAIKNRYHLTPDEVDAIFLKNGDGEETK